MAPHFTIEAGALDVAVVIHRPAGCNAQMARRFHRINVDTQKEEFSAKLFLLSLDRFLHPPGRIAETRVFQAVSGDDKGCAQAHPPS